MLDLDLVNAELNGVRLYGGGAAPDEYGVYYHLDRIEGWWDGAGTTGTVTQRPYAPGGYPDPAFDGSRTIVLVGEITADSGALIRGGIDRLKRAVTVDRLGVLSVEEFGEVRHVRARKDGQPLFPWDGGPVAGYNIQLVAPDARLLSGLGPVGGVPAFTFTQDAFLPSQSGGADFAEVAETARNLATRPSFETASGTIEVRRNLELNPSHEVDSAGYSVAGAGTGAALTTGGYVGPNFYRMTKDATATAATLNLPARAATVNQRRSVSVYVRPSVAVTLSLGIKTTDAGAAVLTDTLGTAIACPANVWTRINHYIAAPANSATAQPYITSSTANLLLDVDALLVEQIAGIFPYFDGATAAAGDFTYAWLGTAHASASVQNAPGVATVAAGGSVAYQSSTVGVGSGAKSVAVRSGGTTTDSFAVMDSGQSGIRHGLVAGKTYTVLARVTTPVALTGTLFRERAIGVFILDGGVYANLISASGPVTGSADLSYTFTIPATATEVFIRLHNGSAAGGETVYWDNFAIIDGTYAGAYFDGSTPAGGGFTYEWVGTPHASVSIQKNVGGLSFPLLFDAVVQSGSVTIPAVGNAVPEVVATIYGPCPAPVIRAGDGQSQWFDLELLANEFLVVDFDRRTVKINGQVSRRGAMRGKWLELSDTGNTLFFDASSYNSAARMSVAANYAWR